MKNHSKYPLVAQAVVWLLFSTFYSPRLSAALEAPANARILVNASTATTSSSFGGDTRFGVMTHFAQGWNTDWIPWVKAGGITYVRDEAYWKDVESTKGVFKFPSLFDNYLAGLKGNKISPLIILSFENPLYDGGLTPYTTDGFNGYARYAVETLRHYGTQVQAVEIWNEYNGSFNHGPASDNRAATYVNMLRVAYTAIKKERPDVTVLGGATILIPLPYWEKIMADGGLDFMDALSIHPYRYESPPEGMEEDVADLQRLTRQYNHGQTKPIWVTEIGWPLKASTAPGDLLVDEDVQAKFLVRTYGLLFSAGVDHVYWYLLRDYDQFTMGLLHDDATRTRKASFAAMQTMIQQLKDAQFVQREKTADDIYSLLFKRTSGEELRILWSLTSRQLARSNATSILAKDGKPMALGTTFAVGDSPLFVTGPFRGLPAPAAAGAILANSKRDFSGSAVNGWTYGAFVGGTTSFALLPTYNVTDWKAEWTGVYPYISITASDQHPSSTANLPVAAVRRWTSNFEGRVHITGSFACGTQGDGVGVSVLVNGTRRFRKVIGGGAGVVQNIDLLESCHVGTTFDFAVDPGPAAAIDYDVTTFSAVIQKAP